jgi:1,3-beta-glucanosyltransferase GAS5
MRIHDKYSKKHVCLSSLILHLVVTLLATLFVSSIQRNDVIGGADAASTNISSTCSSYAMALQLKGKKFFRTIDGAYLPLKGIDYYPRPNVGVYTTSNSNDFYTEEFRSVWERDVAYFQQLNINAVRIYAVDPGKNHDSFMCALKAAGIYAIIGLAADCDNCAILGTSAPDCYPTVLRERGEFIIQQFSRYDNVIGFDAGNEIGLSSGSETINGPCQKQFLRDMRAYVQGCMNSNTMRHIPIGLAVADVDRSQKALYYK